jgi:primosomal protein N' (replication factor Y)
MPDFADILPDLGRPLSQVFTYRVPEALRSRIRVGAQVLVPFGQRDVVGIVAAVREESDRAGLRDIESVFEDAPALPDDALALARWMADYYLCELGEAIRPFLPQGTTYRIQRFFSLTGEPVPDSLRARGDVAVLLRHIEAEGEVSLGALRQKLPAARVFPALRALKSRGVIVERASLRPPEAKAKQVRVLSLSASPEEIAQYCEKHARRSPARVAVLRAAMDAGPLPPAELAQRAGVSLSAVQALVKQCLLKAEMMAMRRVPWAEESGRASAPPTLTSDQAAAVDAVIDAIDADRHESFLLYGVTASGKTEVYLHAIERVLALGRQAIVLMPEISLTAQAVGIYRSRFGDRVAILHSSLSLGERWDEWQRVRDGEAAVTIGARSALFAPTPNLGLIVIDEEHETSYKQEQAPRYHARETALRRGELNHCPVVLASATPALESFYAAEMGRHRLLRLPTRVEARPLPQVRLVDRRESAPRPAILSGPLRQAIGARLAAGEQVILFLNRRGYATFLLCPACGEAVRCPDCGVSLTYHREQHQVRCHHCGLARAAPTVCANCKGHNIRFSGFGTERVEKELAELFPRARLGRLDRDTTAHKGSHLEIVGRFRSAETDILIGTQMVAKGFDFPGVTLVGVISADTSLNVPDFRAAERTFQLLTQVSGRSGRGDKPGEVVVQTFQPDHYSVIAASRQDYEGFYRGEIETRRELNYPPFSQIANLVATANTEADAQARAEKIAAAIRENADALDVLGPAAAPIAKLRGKHRWHLLVRARPGALQSSLRAALSTLGDLPALGLTVDVDPVSLM